MSKIFHFCKCIFSLINFWLKYISEPALTYFYLSKGAFAVFFFIIFFTKVSLLLLKYRKWMHFPPLLLRNIWTSLRNCRLFGWVGLNPILWHNSAQLDCCVDMYGGSREKPIGLRPPNRIHVLMCWRKSIQIAAIIRVLHGFWFIIRHPGLVRPSLALIWGDLDDKRFI